MRAISIIILCALALLGVSIAIFFADKGSSLPQALDTQLVATSSITTITTSIEENQGASPIPKDMHEYRSATYHFSLFYPKGLIVNERSEGGGATTITFQNIEKVEGFQIFIAPYEEAQISEQRFKQDVPSGVRESLTNIMVDGTTGAAFYSANTALGATFEMWFIHGGFLYEVTTLKPLETWLGQIISTWRFI